MRDMIENNQADSYQGFDDRLVRLRRIADQSYDEGGMIGVMV